MSLTPNYAKLKKNGTTLYVLPGVAEDKAFENQNENYKMSISHFALVNFPRQEVGKILDPESSFNQNGSSIQPATFKDQLVESLRNYVANHEVVIRNSKISSNTFYYDTFQPATIAEKAFWKWCRKLGVIDWEPADPVLEWFGTDPKYNDRGPTGNTDHFREYFWKERDTNTIYDANNVALGTPGITIPVLGPPPLNYQYATITLTASTSFKPGDFISLTSPVSTTLGNLTFPATVPITVKTVQLEIAAVATNISLNDQVIVLINQSATLADFGSIPQIEIVSAYHRFVQLVGEISAVNNVQLPDRAYTETVAHISYQHGQSPYILWRTAADNNYKPGSVWPILPSEIQAEIQGGENANNPILTNPGAYPGDIWGHFDTPAFTYTSSNGDQFRRSGAYYGNYAANNVNPTLKYPDWDAKDIDGMTMNLDILDYAKAVSYQFPIESFLEFCSTAFDNVAPKDAEYNAILWYYTIEDVSGNQTRSATNLYGIEFLDNPDNDFAPAKTLITPIKQLVSNGYQDGTAYTWSLDLNYAIDSDVQPPSFDPEKIYSLFGMDLFYEALTRLTYFNDQVTTLVANNTLLQQKVEALQGLVWTQQTLESVRSRMDSLEALLNVYSTLQIGTSSSIEPELDTSVSPPLVRLNSIDKQYGFIYVLKTRDMFQEFVNVNTFTETTPVVKTIPVKNGKDFLQIVYNNDYNQPSPQYDPSLILPKLELVIEKDLSYKQKLDILVLAKAEPIANGSPINNKGLNLYINYSDGIAQSTTKLLLTTLDLPLLKFKSGIVLYDQPSVSAEFLPTWRPVKTFYSAPTAAERVFSFIIEEDLFSNQFVAPFSANRAPVASSVFIKNMLLENNPLVPTGQYKKFDGQYTITNTSYTESTCIAAEILNPGSAYTPSSTGYYRYAITGYPTGYEILVRISSFANGKLSSIEVLNQINALPSQLDWSPPILASTLTFVSGTNLLTSGTGATLRFKSIVRSRIDIGLNFTVDALLNSFLANYDIATGANVNLGLYYSLDQWLKHTPEISYLRGWIIRILRVSDTAIVPIPLITDRYDIKIEPLS